MSYEKVKDDFVRVLDISDITTTELQDEQIGPIIIQEYIEQVAKRMKGGKFMDILSGYTISIFQDFENNLRKKWIWLKSHNIKLVLDDHNSNFFTYELTPGIYTFEGLSETLLKVLQPEYEGYHNAIDIDFDDITRKLNCL